MILFTQDPFRAARLIGVDHIQIIQTEDLRSVIWMTKDLWGGIVIFRE